MNFFRLNQNSLRIECYQGLLDHVQNSASNDPYKLLKLIKNNNKNTGTTQSNSQ